MNSTGMAGAALVQEDSTQECSVGNILNPLNENMEQSIGVEECIRNNKLLLANGKSVNIITNVCQVKDVNQPMPLKMYQCYATQDAVALWSRKKL